MTERRIIDVDLTDRADGKVPIWDTAAGTHLYGDPATAAGSGRLIGVQRFTATGAATYTPTAGTAAIIIELVGGGGGGGGVAAGTSNQTKIGGGGGGGAYLRKRLTANFSGAAIVVGAKGAGGASGGNNPGSNGASSTFTDTAGSPTVYTAAGGTGGGVGAGAPFQLADGGAGGAATNGDDNVPGGPGQFGVGYTGPFFANGGTGGASRHSGGADATRVAANPGQAAGISAAGKGGGGSGAANVGTGTTQAGGDGSDGIVIVWEYA